MVFVLRQQSACDESPVICMMVVVLNVCLRVSRQGCHISIFSPAMMQIHYLDSLTQS